MDNQTSAKHSKPEVPIWEKALLTIDEASAYFNIGVNKLRELTNDENCPYVLWSGSRRLIKRKLFEEHLSDLYSI
ncbi:MAG: excisionase family DNA-binding protein [Saccharofermentans sp.]|nr:excisionase family DNA-binding protein [Saccharofermentans sp.]